jgi:hypothetical protein
LQRRSLRFGMQKTVFWNELARNYGYKIDGDLYIDGRAIAEALGIRIPDVKAKRCRGLAAPWNPAI